jgi:hypothetical protein
VIPIAAWETLEASADRQRAQLGIVGKETARAWLDFWTREQSAGIEPTTNDTDLTQRLALFCHGHEPPAIFRRRGLAMARRLVAERRGEE